MGVRIPILLFATAAIALLFWWLISMRLPVPGSDSNAPLGNGQDLPHRNSPAAADGWDQARPNAATTLDKKLNRDDDADEKWARQSRIRMVEQQLRGRDICNPDVLAAMGRVPRHRFVSPRTRHLAYADRPLPIGHGQTISQPYVVALMTQLAQPKPNSRALDVGTGCGYQAAVLAEIVDEVYSIEILCDLAEEARHRLAELGYDNIRIRCGDGYRGWPGREPFDVIIVAAAPDHLPPPLVDQLVVGGRLVIPVGRYFQKLLVVEKQPDGSLRKQTVASVAFVPMTGEAEEGK